jgi:SAM-dependent methyltransferase
MSRAVLSEPLVPPELDQPVIAARWADCGGPEWVTYRRYLLDGFLSWSRPHMRGRIIDLGGKRAGKRGRFRPATGTGTWTYVNLDRNTEPDIFADVSAVPLPDGLADCVVCTEVLEHLSLPQACIDEAHRLLRPGGTLIASVPFLYPVHADPHDFQRFTAQGLRRLCARFSAVEVLPMGGWLGTAGLFLELRALKAGGAVRRRLLRAVALLLCWADLRAGAARAQPALPEFTSGYFVVARRGEV